MPRKSNAYYADERRGRRELALSSLEEFIKLVHPKRMLGNIHRDVINWWTRQEAKHYQLLLLPRDHMKSALIAYRVAWEITKDPTLRVLFISSTSNLATKQLKFIKDILTSDNYRLYWPEMVNPDEAKREKWTEREISVDHPARKDEAIREPTIFTAGLTTNIVGLHCDIAVLDDVVVEANGYTKEGREKVQNQYSYLSSIEGTGAREWIVGTRYHPDDLYAQLAALEVDSEVDERGNVIKSEYLFEVKEHQVESVGDGTGEFLWPRQKRSDGKWFGFDAKILAEKRSKYINKLQFRAQYYNDPNDSETSPIKRDCFQYYEPSFLTRIHGQWSFQNNRLNVYASVDFAYTTGKKSDSTAIVVVGVTGNHDYYILEIDRFKTNLHSEIYEHILRMYDKWGFRKIRAETTAAQSMIVNDIKENYIRKNGISLIVEEFRPSKWIGSKEERILATLEPKYANRQIWHYPGGNCQLLEEELVLQHPPHDDIKDALASVVDFAKAPMNIYTTQKETMSYFQYHGKFGGVV